MKSGRLLYGSADLGYNVINDHGRRLGAFVGYRSFYERGNGFGCAQRASNGWVCQPTIPADYNALSETESWRGVAVGINGQAMLTNRLRLEVDAAYLPYVNLAGFDNHWFRSDINPLVESGHGRGAQFEAVLSYAVTDRLSVGTGARYWLVTSDEAHTRFPFFPDSPMAFASERFGGFLQASYKFGDGGAADKADAIREVYNTPAPLRVTDWSGVYLGGIMGAGKGRSRYADPFPPPVSDDSANLGGALAGGRSV